jgi:ABC-2 type transport system ATP-binding protein
MGQDVTHEKVEKFLTFFNLQDFTDELMEGYLHSMRQKLVIAGAFYSPKVVIVDKPLVGLDPKSARQVKQLFQDLCENGTTIFVTTHS